MKQWLKNKPWQKWATCKLAFIYCLVLGTILIVLSYVALFFGFDPSALLDVALSFPKWVVTTGTVVVVAGRKKKDSDEEQYQKRAKGTYIVPFFNAPRCVVFASWGRCVYWQDYEIY